jgi:acyl-coenzyme A thioesterase PaaI-like protein
MTGSETDAMSHPNDDRPDTMTDPVPAPGDDDARLVASRRAGAAARELIGALVSSTAPAADLEAVAASLEAVNARLRPHAVKSRFEGVEGLRIGRDSAFDERIFEYHPFAGPSNPLAPPLVLSQTASGNAVATVTYDHRHEGMPSRVHGGVLAAAFDLILAAAASRAAGRPAPTGRLTIRYRVPTPLHTELRYESWLHSHEGRKILTKATVSAGDEVCAEAEGLFIAARTEMLPVVGTADA